MKKLMVGLLLVLFLCTSANAMPIKLNIGAYGDGDNPTEAGFTSVFSQMQFFANTTSTQFGAGGPGSLPVVGDTFVDAGNLNITSYVGLQAPGYDQGLGAAGETTKAYSITGSWSGLTGSIVGSGAIGPNTFQTTQYDSGTTIDLYIDDDVDQDFGATLGASDDTGFGADPGTTKIGTIQITGGTGINVFNTATGAFISGSTVLSGKFTALADDFWYTATGEDIYDEYFLTIGWEVTTDVDQNTDNVSVNGIYDGTTMFTIDSDHDGSIDVNVVPEPTTLILMGLGLLGLAGVSRKKMTEKKN